MDSAEFLDILGNANRRRILRLLSERPCYVTEISEFLGVSPKAVIDHLRKLEDAGLVESRTDDRRRKYFSISRHVRLEVTVSPYEFGTKSAYPASSGLDVSSCRQLTVELDGTTDDDRQEPDVDGNDDGDVVEIASLATRLSSFETLARELSLTQRWAQGKITALREELADRVEYGDRRLVSDVLVAVADGTSRTEEVSREVDAPPRVVEDVLEQLADDGVVERDGRHWSLAESYTGGRND
jgi:ArsR family transcriptional regulator